MEKATLKHLVFNTLAGAAMAMAAQGAPAAPVLQFNDRGLTGATGVQVDGSLFDVQFVGGTCGVVFGTQCGSPNAASSFLFSQAMAVDASQALLDQVGVFNQGIGANCNVAGGCMIVLTPFNANQASVFNQGVGANCNVGSGCTIVPTGDPGANCNVGSGCMIVRTEGIGPANGNVAGIFSEIDVGLFADTTNTAETFAVFTPSADVPSADVPEPASAALVAAGVVTVGVARRKRRKA